jgi:hypothetical protein
MFRKGFFLTILLIINKNHEKMQSFTFCEEIFIEYRANIYYNNGPCYKMGNKGGAVYE